MVSSNTKKMFSILGLTIVFWFLLVSINCILYLISDYEQIFSALASASNKDFFCATSRFDNMIDITDRLQSIVVKSLAIAFPLMLTIVLLIPKIKRRMKSKEFIRKRENLEDIKDEGGPNPSSGDKIGQVIRGI